MDPAASAKWLLELAWLGPAVPLGGNLRSVSNFSAALSSKLPVEELLDEQPLSHQKYYYPLWIDQR